jgi:hypothetical protein
LLINLAPCGFRVLGAILIVVGLYSVLWGKYKEYKEKEAMESIPEAVKGGGEKGRMATVMEDIEANDFEMPKGEANNKETVPVVAIGVPIQQPTTIAVKAPKAQE